MTNTPQEAMAILKIRGLSELRRAQRLRLEADLLDGVRRVYINYILDTVTIRYDAGKLTLAEVKKKLDVG